MGGRRRKSHKRKANPENPQITLERMNEHLSSLNAPYRIDYELTDDGPNRPETRVFARGLQGEQVFSGEFLAAALWCNTYQPGHEPYSLSRALEEAATWGFKRNEILTTKGSSPYDARLSGKAKVFRQIGSGQSRQYALKVRHLWVVDGSKCEGSAHEI